MVVPEHTLKTVAVGSTNLIKVGCVREAFHAVWPETRWRVAGCEAASGVREQPLYDAESLKGARTRAKVALHRKKEADFGVGLEGGLHRLGSVQMESGVIVVMDRQGNEGVGSTPRIMIPQYFLAEMHGGRTLSELCDEAFGTPNVGYFGLLTNGAITRQTAYRDGVIFALARFVQPQLFEDKAAGD